MSWKNRSTSCVCVLYYMEAFCFIVGKEPLANSRRPCRDLSTFVNSRVVSGWRCSARADVAHVTRAVG